uniref:Methyltransferase domain-containing protein n=1 Tax=Chromera velia CCMP2878 TaxID=1169474 RepID=A0A0G4I6Y6_9ALVE|eukprot:Cvel_1919.t1-p1 / transcript=Cvel_1919.t1 / gene=Cvel_1919 / organism=Chromera_velia_CCMP2878 / gene_product=hypothetical protein / transcript_product=hypothetical protein / location=Cvel_scaffold72:11188-13379(+) / protein_length=380 / sequence_SO=supercontig / SO=protein_coding / is_pseudo=false
MPDKLKTRRIGGCAKAPEGRESVFSVVYWVVGILRSLWRTRNSLLALGSFVASVLIGWFSASVVLGVAWYFFLLFSYDVAYYLFGVAVICPTESIAHGYTLGVLTDRGDGSAKGEGLDYGFNLYRDMKTGEFDFKKPRTQALEDKFTYAFNALGLEKGMWLLDCGCGCGVWLRWLKDRGVNVVGVNITKAQVDMAKAKGLEVICTDWKDVKDSPELQKKLFNRFDAVSFWDTVEHYVPAGYRKDKAKQDAIYASMFGLAKACIRQGSSLGRIWISCLHFDPNNEHMAPSLRRKLNLTNYLLDKQHSGCYPTYKDRQLTRNAQKEGFALVREDDLTYDYYMTSVLEPTHFGRHEMGWNVPNVFILSVNAFFDPNWMQRLLW